LLNYANFSSAIARECPPKRVASSNSGIQNEFKSNVLQQKDVSIFKHKYNIIQSSTPSHKNIDCISTGSTTVRDNSKPPEKDFQLNAKKEIPAIGLQYTKNIKLMKLYDCYKNVSSKSNMRIPGRQFLNDIKMKMPNTSKMSANESSLIGNISFNPIISRSSRALEMCKSNFTSKEDANKINKKLQHLSCISEKKIIIRNVLPGHSNINYFNIGNACKGNFHLNKSAKTSNSYVDESLLSHSKLKCEYKGISMIKKSLSPSQHSSLNFVNEGERIHAKYSSRLADNVFTIKHSTNKKPQHMLSSIINSSNIKI